MAAAMPGYDASTLSYIFMLVGSAIFPVRDTARRPGGAHFRHRGVFRRDRGSGDRLRWRDIIRDIVAGVPFILLRPELYVTPAALSAMLCGLGIIMGLPDALSWGVATAAGLALRSAAIRWNIMLPAYSRGR